METKLSAMMLALDVQHDQISVPIVINRVRVSPGVGEPVLQPLGGVVSTSAFISVLRELIEVLEEDDNREKLDRWLRGQGREK